MNNTRLIVGGIMLGVLVSAFAGVPYIGADSDWGVARSEGLVDPYTGNLSFEVTDVSASGAVGRYRLEWSRVATSRDPGVPSFFGGGHHWAHSWQWTLAFSEESEGTVARVYEPSGATYAFKQAGDGAWAAVSPAVKHRATGKGWAIIMNFPKT